MGGQYGVDQIGLLVDLGCEAVNVGEDLANKEGLFSVFKLSDEARAIAGLDKALLKQQLGELDREDHLKLQERAIAKLDLANDVLEAKIEGGMDLVGDMIDLGVDTYKDVSGLIDRAKALFG